MTTKTKSKHIFYFDALRALAIVSVIILHTTGFMVKIIPWNHQMFFTPGGFWEIFSYNTFRFAVGLFLMISGALLLGRESTIKDFLSKRLPRIVKPFVFWGIVVTSIMIITAYFVPQIGFIKNFAWWNILYMYYKAFIFKAPSFAAYWYFWLILGVYLIFPIFNRWVVHSDLEEIEYFLIIWFIASIFAYTLMHELFFLSYFTSPIGFVLMGYYLRHTKREIFNNKIFIWVLIIVPVAIMLAYSYSIVKAELFNFYKDSILIIIESMGIFCLFRNSTYFNNPNGRFKKFIALVSTCSYGIYLTHCMFIHIIGKLAPTKTLHFFGTYALIFFGALFGSLILIYVLDKVPIIGDYVGIK